MSSISPRCLGELEDYHRIVQHGAASRFDAQELAQLELQWWRERRRNVQAQDYAQTVARLTASLYGVGESQVFQAANLRTTAMAYRDARRNGRMQEADWTEVEQQLTAAYEALRDGINHNSGAR